MYLVGIFTIGYIHNRSVGRNFKVGEALCFFLQKVGEVRTPIIFTTFLTNDGEAPASPASPLPTGRHNMEILPAEQCVYTL